VWATEGWSASSVMTIPPYEWPHPSRRIDDILSIGVFVSA
jgi:hypothetical protein